MGDLPNPLHLIKPFSLEQVGGESFLIHKQSADIFHLNAFSRLYVECFQQGIAKSQIITAVARRFELSSTEVASDFDGFIASLSASNRQQSPSLKENLRLIDPEDFIPRTPSTRTNVGMYAVGGLLFRITSKDHNCLRLVDARLQLMRDKNPQTPQNACKIHIHSGENGYGIYVNGGIQVAVEDDTWLDVLVMQAMLDQLTARSEATVILHAAAIANASGDVVIFTAPSGSGKSTLATYMALNGYTYLGDDLVLLNPFSKEITPFPTAPNLKPDSWPLFKKTLPKLKAQAIFRPNIRPVKFACLAAEPFLQTSYKVKALVFPEYHKGTPAKIDSLSLADSMSYLSEIRRSVPQGHLTAASLQLIKFTSSTPCFALRYSDINELENLGSHVGL